MPVGELDYPEEQADLELQAGTFAAAQDLTDAGVTLQNLLTLNDQVCFGVDAYTDTLDDYASVLIEGRLTAVTDPREKARIRSINDAKYDRLRRGYRPGHGRSTALSELPLRKIVVERVSGRRKEPKPHIDEEAHGRRTA